MTVTDPSTRFLRASLRCVASGRFAWTRPARKAVLHEPQSEQYHGDHADQGDDEHGVDLTRRPKLLYHVVTGSGQAQFRNGTRRYRA